MRNLYRSTGIARFDNAFSSMDNHLKISGSSISTRRSYCHGLSKFVEYSSRLPDECTKNELVNFIVDLQKERGFGTASLKKYILSIRYYLKCVAERMDLYTKIPIPRIKKYNVEILNVNELSLLFEACKNIRDVFIMQLLYETGMRIKELLNLRYCDFDLYNNTITIRNSKNHKTRTVYFGETLRSLLIKYHASNLSLFSQSVNNIQFHPFFNISKSGVRHMMRSALKRAGLTKRVTPHLLRHAFAVHYLNFGGTIYQLQKLLGWTSSE